MERQTYDRHYFGKTILNGSLRRKAGTSLVEILVVIVVFLIGILAVVQIFPGGFRILTNTRALSVANAMARDQVEKLKGYGETLPEMILPVTSDTGLVDSTRYPNDLSLYDQPGTTLNADGTITYGGVGLLNWAYYFGPNVFRKVIGEGGPVPAPRQVGSIFAGLMFLHFAPMRTTNAIVYGNDYEIQVGALPNGYTLNSTGYLNSATSGQLSVSLDDPAARLRISFSMYVKDGGGITRRRDIIGQVITAGGPFTVAGKYLQVPLSAFVAAGETFLRVEPESLRVQRVFDAVSKFSTTDPYEYMLFPDQLGEIYFSPLGYNYRIVRQNGAEEHLLAKVDYEVLDWRDLSDEFRIDSGETIYRLSVMPIKVLNSASLDGMKYLGLGIQTPNASAALVNVDVMILDETTGGLVTYDPKNPADPSPPSNATNDINIDPALSSVYVDKSAGTFKLVDFDRDPTNGIQVLESFEVDPTSAVPSFSVPAPVNVNGHSLKVFYQAKGDWMVQPQLAANVYHETTGIPGAAQFVVGSGTRIYFPNMDLGRKVNVGTAYYSDGTIVRKLENQSFVIRNVPSDPGGPYIDLREFDRNAVALDFSHGYAVQGVRGISVGVRVIQNPTYYQLPTASSAARLQSLDQFSRSWRRTSVETFVQRGGF